MTEFQTGEIEELDVPSLYGDAIGAIRELVNERATVEELELGEVYAVRHADGEVSALPTLPYVKARDEYEKAREKETLKSGLVTVHDPDSFTQYIGRHGGIDTEVWMDLPHRKVTAVLDGDSPDKKGLHQHKVQMQLLYTPDWAAWKQLDRKYVRQSVLGEFIIDHYANFVEPSAAAMLNHATTFQAIKNVDFQSVENVKNGEKSVSWIETIGQKQVPGQAELPELVRFNAQIFEYGEIQQLTARWFYTIEDKSLLMKLLIDDVVEIERLAFESLCDDLEGLLNALDTPPAVFHGSDRD